MNCSESRCRFSFDFVPLHRARLPPTSSFCAFRLTFHLYLMRDNTCKRFATRRSIDFSVDFSLFVLAGLRSAILLAASAAKGASLVCLGRSNVVIIKITLQTFHISVNQRSAIAFCVRQRKRKIENRLRSALQLKRRCGEWRRLRQAKSVFLSSPFRSFQKS